MKNFTYKIQEHGITIDTSLDLYVAISRARRYSSLRGSEIDVVCPLSIISIREKKA